MRIDIFTLFPTMFDGPFTQSILKRARENGLLDIRLTDIRDYTTDKHRTTDDTPYGGGGGMVMKGEPILRALEAQLGDQFGHIPLILTTPTGQVFDQALARRLAEQPQLGFICGHYEGIDDRVRQLVHMQEVSIGDYVLTGGELAVMVMVDAIARHLPGVLGAENAAAEDSHATGLLEYPHYTRPAVLRGLAVPEVLLNGNHAAIAKWRRQEAIRRTWQRRPDMLPNATLSKAEQAFLASLGTPPANHDEE